MLKKISLTLVFALIIGVIFSGFLAAAQEDSQSTVKSQVTFQ